MARHWHWWRGEGLARVLEEKDVRPGRVTEAYARRRWRRRAGRCPGAAEPPTVLWVVGLQRSGTNMVMRALARTPEVELRNEDDRRAFVGYRLRGDDELRAVIAGSRHRVVAFKPLCDSHRTVELLDGVSPIGRGRAVWVYRSVDGRVRSATSRFGDHAREALADVALGRGRHWQGEGLPADTLATLRAVDWTTTSPESAQAWLWWARNKLVVDLGLDRRDDVLVVSYDRLVTDPEGELGRLAALAGLPMRPALTTGIEPRRPSELHLEGIDDEVRARCAELTGTLDALAARPVSISR